MLKGLIKVRPSVGKETSMLFDCNMISIKVVKIGGFGGNMFYFYLCL